MTPGPRRHIVKTTSFCDVLRALRAKEGYSSARAFHRARCSRPRVCSYTTYADTEHGRQTPTWPLASRLAQALRLRAGTRDFREYRRSYLQALTRSRALTEVLLVSLRPEPRKPSLLESVLTSGAERPRLVMSDEQARLMRSNPIAFQCFLALSSSSGSWSPLELASFYSASTARVQAALSKLVRAGLAERRSSFFHCPHWDRNIVYPRPDENSLAGQATDFSGRLPPVRWARRGTIIIRAQAGSALELSRLCERWAAYARTLHRPHSDENPLQAVGAFVWRLL